MLMSSRYFKLHSSFPTWHIVPHVRKNFVRINFQAGQLDFANEVVPDLRESSR